MQSGLQMWSWTHRHIWRCRNVHTTNILDLSRLEPPHPLDLVEQRLQLVVIELYEAAHALASRSRMAVRE
jgi:hypothetical protein